MNQHQMKNGKLICTKPQRLMANIECSEINVPGDRIYIHMWPQGDMDYEKKSSSGSRTITNMMEWLRVCSRSDRGTTAGKEAPPS